MLTLQDLERQCNGKTYYAGFGLTLLPGCLIRLEGASGSGKTMLMEVIAGRQSCSSGSVQFAGEESRGDKEFFSDLTYIPENQDDLTLRWTVEKQLKRWSRKGEQELMSAATHYFQLTPWLEVPLKKLSKGWRQRVRLARLMLQPTAIWLLDRPFLYLDDPARLQLENLIAGRCRQNGIVIFSHDGTTHLNPHGVVALP